MNDPLAHVVVGEHDARPLLRVMGEVDMTNAAAIGEQLRAHAGDAPTVLVDLTDLGFLDSRGLHMLQRLSDEMAGRGTEVIVIAPVPGIAGNLLRLVGMDKTLDVRATVSDQRDVADPGDGPVGTPTSQ